MSGPWEDFQGPWMDYAKSGPVAGQSENVFDQFDPKPNPFDRFDSRPGVQPNGLARHPNPNAPTNMPATAAGPQSPEENDSWWKMAPLVREEKAQPTATKGFDVEGARKAGYSDAEIADYLGKQSGFDVAGARKAGYSDAEIVAYLATPPKSDTYTKGARVVGQFAQGANDAIASTLGGPVDAAAWVLRQMGVPANNPVGGSESIKRGIDYIATLPGRIGDAVQGGSLDPLTEQRTSRFAPATKGERVANAVGDALGNVVSTVVPAGFVARATEKAAPVVAELGSRARNVETAAPSLAGGIAKSIAANPVQQFGYLAAGSAAGAATDNPMLGVATTFALPMLAHGATRIPFAAPARTGAEAERRSLLATAQKEGIPVSFGNITNSTPAKMFESVTSKLPFIGGQQAALNEKAKTAFAKAAFRKVPEVASEGIDAATPGNLDLVKSRIGRAFNRLEDDTTVRVDSQFGSDLAAAKADFSQQLRSQMPKSISDKLDELESAALARNENRAGDTLSVLSGHQGPEVTIDGRTYKNIRSKLSAQLKSATGTDRQAIGAMIDALDGAVERSLPKDMVKDWQNARQSWRRYMMIKGATDARHNGQTDLGYIPPGSLAARAGHDKEMARLASVGTSFVGDKMPDSGTAGRLLYQNLLGLGAGGAGAYAFPMTTAALAGGGYIANALMNNPITRAALIARLNNARESVVSKGLLGTLAAEEAQRQRRLVGP